MSEVVNYSEWGIPLGRQFRALKLWFVLRAYGLEGLRTMIRNHIAWSRALCEKLRAAPDFEIVTEPCLLAVLVPLRTDRRAISMR